MFRTNTENPELIWNEEMRNGIHKILRQILIDLLDAQHADPNAKWNIVSLI